MKTLKTISFICYALVGLLGFVFAFIYLFRSEFMPYHAVAVGTEWNTVDDSMKVLILALMRVSGGGWLATSISITILLIARSKFTSSIFSIGMTVVGLGALIPTLYATLYVRGNSPADPPWIAAVLGIVLLVIALVLDSIAGYDSRKKNS
jgi:hypothetical protein